MQSLLLKLCFLFLWAASAGAEPKFGLELELGAMDRLENDGEVAPERYQELMEFVRESYGQRGKIELQDWEKHPGSGQKKAVYADPKGRSWRVVPEDINDWGTDGFELVTPPLDSASETDLRHLEKLYRRILEGGKFGPGVYSSTHFTFGAEHLVSPEGDIRAALETILFIEGHWPEIYASISPSRYGTVTNKFAVPLAANQRDLLEELSALLRRPGRITKADARAIFERYAAREETIKGMEVAEATWKFRAANYKKFFALDGDKELNVFEFRLPDLPAVEEIRPNLEFFRSMMQNGARLQRGTKFRNPYRHLGADPTYSEIDEETERLSSRQHRSFLRKLGLDPERYPKLGRLGGTTTFWLPDAAFAESFRPEAAESLLRGDDPPVKISVGRGSHLSRVRSLRKLKPPPGSAPLILRLELPDSVLEHLPESDLIRLGENFLTAAEAIAVSRGKVAATRSGCITLQKKSDKVLLEVQALGDGGRTLEGFVTRLLHGLQHPELLAPADRLGWNTRTAAESLPDRLDRFSVQYTGKPLKRAEKDRLHWAQTRANDLPLRGLSESFLASPLEKRAFANADYIFNKNVLYNLRRFRNDQEFLRWYRINVSDWVSSLDLGDLLVNSTLKRPGLTTERIRALGCADQYGKIK